MDLLLTKNPIINSLHANCINLMIIPQNILRLLLN